MFREVTLVRRSPNNYFALEMNASNCTIRLSLSRRPFDKFDDYFTEEYCIHAKDD